MRRSSERARPETVRDAVAREVLVALESVVTRAAIGAARTAIRLGTVAKRHEAIERIAKEFEDISAKIRQDIESAAGAAAETASASQKVAALAREGRAESSQSTAHMTRLLQKSDATNERMRSLMTKIKEVTGVSRVIADIAGRTRLLALNASIEATRAGASGRAFAVVANEVRELAKNTSLKTNQIDDLMRAILADLEPARLALEESRALVEETAESVRAVDERLAAVNELAETASESVSGIVSAVDEHRRAVVALSQSTDTIVTSIKDLREEAQISADDAFAVADMADEGEHQLARVDVDTRFHRGLARCRELAERCGAILDRAVEGGGVRLDDVLTLEYREIKGDDIRSLARLFDVGRVPLGGFTPPKYHTRYDELVDVDLQEACEAVIGHDEKLLFALPIDLNSYGPIHNRRYMKDWTGVPEKDLAGNRIKRFFTDNSALVLGARVGLGKEAAKLPHRATRPDFQRTACDLADSPEQRDAFMVRTYARDTGSFVTVVTVPIFVQGQRWGAGLVGWTEDGRG